MYFNIKKVGKIQVHGTRNILRFYKRKKNIFSLINAVKIIWGEQEPDKETKEIRADLVGDLTR